jgi:hypothetical protein
VKARLTEQDFADAAAFLSCEVAAVHAVAEVESGAQGGFAPNDFPTTLFEGHIFHRYTKGAYDRSHQTLSYPKWTTQYYGHGYVEEQARLTAAAKLDRTAALMSASWGRFQIMGFNFPVVGCTSVQQFVTLMCRSEREQGALFVKYIVHEGLVDELQQARWADFARYYNGPLYTKNQYDVKLQAAYVKWGGKYNG